MILSTYGDGLAVGLAVGVEVSVRTFVGVIVGCVVGVADAATDDTGVTMAVVFIKALAICAMPAISNINTTTPTKSNRFPSTLIPYPLNPPANS